MAGWLVVPNPSFLADARTAPSWVLRALDESVYPALRDDPTDRRRRDGLASSSPPLSYEWGWWIYTVDRKRQGDGLAWVFYQAIDDERIVMLFYLRWLSLADE